MTTLDALPAQIAIVNRDGTLAAVNEAWRRFGRGSEAPGDQARPGADFIEHCRQASGGVGNCSKLADGVEAVLRGRRKEFTLEYPCRVRGEEKWFHIRVTPYDGRKSGSVVVAREDISERVRLEREIVAVSTREQQRLRQELHDGLSQYLTGLKFKASLLEYHLQARNLPEAAEAKSLSELLNAATEEAARLARRLRPVEVEARGLMMALRELAANTSQSRQTTCEVEIRRPVFIHDNDTATNLYRLAEEAVSAALQREGVLRIDISLNETRQCVTLSVRDNGRHGGDGAEDGISLHLMHYYARMIGGALEWRHNAAKGTTMSCRFERCSAAPAVVKE